MARCATSISKCVSAQGFEPSAGSPGQFSEVIRREVAKWTQVVKTSGFKAE
jgi:tripartite-type tricarboxylate transporter receptor subunit TctC